jgi:flagellin-specific chaperone FliS
MKTITITNDQPFFSINQMKQLINQSKDLRKQQAKVIEKQNRIIQELTEQLNNSGEEWKRNE